MNELDQAAKRFMSFHDRRPGPGELLTVEMQAKVQVLAIGPLVGVAYAVRGEKKPNFHYFSRAARPTLLVSYDGTQLFVSGGAYRFGARGIVG